MSMSDVLTAALSVFEGEAFEPTLAALVAVWGFYVIATVFRSLLA